MCRTAECGRYSLAALARLGSLHLTDRCDVVEGAGAGAVNGSYFVAGQASEALGLYTELSQSKEFISFSRRHGLLDVDYSIDSVLKRRFRIDPEQYWDSPTECERLSSA